jgi:hypothetical protein
MRAAALLIALAFAAPAGAQVVSPAPERAAVTIYRTGEGASSSVRDEYDEESEQRGVGLAFISETRTVDLPAGRSRISFRGVADTMVPETAAVEGLPGAVIERNEDFNLLSPGSILQAYVGKPVKLVRTDRATGKVTVQQAILRSGPYHPVLEIDGKLEGLRCSGAPERLVFDEAPANLSDKPTFSVLADVPRAGRYTVRLSYLATGFNWSADYVAKVAPDGQTLDLFAWLTLSNHTSASFAQAPTDVVAGDLSRDGETAPPEVEPLDVAVSCWPVSRPLRARFRSPPAEYRSFAGYAGAPGSDEIQEIVVTAAKIARQSDLGDYKLYTLPEPTTVAAHQTKQVAFLDQRSVPFERIYSYRLDLDDYDLDEPEAQAPTVVLRLKNTEGRGLGKPLPSGVVSVMEPGGAGLVLAGEHKVKDTPVGLPLELELGQAMDVSVKVTLVEDHETDDGGWVLLQADFANDKPEPVVIEYRQAPYQESFRIKSASRRAGTKNGDPIWTIRLKPGERASLTYKLTYKD